MPKVKKVTRTYVNKRGQTVTKTYEYESSTYAPRKGRLARKGYNLITKSKSGKISVRRKNVERLKEEIRNDGRLTDQEKRYLIQDVEDIVEARASQGMTLTSTGFYGTIAMDPIDRFFANMGRTTDEAAMELGVGLDDLRDEANWKWSGSVGTFIDPVTGASYAIAFSYEGSLSFTRA